MSPETVTSEKGSKTSLYTHLVQSPSKYLFVITVMDFHNKSQQIPVLIKSKCYLYLQYIQQKTADTTVTVYYQLS